MRYEFRHWRTKRQVYVNVFDTPFPESDEQYDLVICHYTGAFIARKEAIVLGAIVPQAGISYLCHPLAEDARKSSVRIFQENEQNCNTCRHLKRIKFDKDYWVHYGLIPGECLNEERKPLYPQDGNKILFAPDDCMMQPCYEGRNNS